MRQKRDAAFLRYRWKSVLWLYEIVWKLDLKGHNSQVFRPKIHRRWMSFNRAAIYGTLIWKFRWWKVCILYTARCVHIQLAARHLAGEMVERQNHNPAIWSRANFVRSKQNRLVRLSYSVHSTVVACILLCADGINWSEAANKKSILRDKFSLWLCVIFFRSTLVPNIPYIVSIQI